MNQAITGCILEEGMSNFNREDLVKIVGFIGVIELYFEFQEMEKMGF